MWYKYETRPIPDGTYAYFSNLKTKQIPYWIEILDIKTYEFAKVHSIMVSDRCFHTFYFIFIYFYVLTDIWIGQNKQLRMQCQHSVNVGFKRHWIFFWIKQFTTQNFNNWARYFFPKWLGKACTSSHSALVRLMSTGFLITFYNALCPSLCALYNFLNNVFYIRSKSIILCFIQI
jgi:hypothetical protein